MLWNVNSGYLQVVKFYDNLKFMNYTIMYTIMPHILHIPPLTHRPLGWKGTSWHFKGGETEAAGKSGTSRPPPPTPSHPSPGLPRVAMDRVGGSLCLQRMGQQPGVRSPSSGPGAQLGHKGGEQGGVQVGGGWVEAKIGDLSKIETR